MADDKGAKSVEQTLLELRAFTERQDPFANYRRRMLSAADAVLTELIALATTAENQNVRLSACKDLLDRIGLVAPQPGARADEERPATAEEMAEAEEIAERLRAKK